MSGYVEELIQGHQLRAIYTGLQKGDKGDAGGTLFHKTAPVEECANSYAIVGQNSFQEDE